MLKPHSIEEEAETEIPNESISKLNDDNTIITNKTNSTQKRHVHFQEQDGLSRPPGSRPSSAPAEPNAKAAKKAYKKMEKEQR